MKNNLLILLFVFQIAKADSLPFGSCGIYKVKGVVRNIGRSASIVVNEKTQSEFTITPMANEEIKIIPYIDKFVTVELLLNREFNGTSGQAEHIKNIELGASDPLALSGASFKLINKTKCLKSITGNHAHLNKNVHLQIDFIASSSKMLHKGVPSLKKPRFIRGFFCPKFQKENLI